MYESWKIQQEVIKSISFSRNPLLVLEEHEKLKADEAKKEAELLKATQILEKKLHTELNQNLVDNNDKEKLIPEEKEVKVEKPEIAKVKRNINKLDLMITLLSFAFLFYLLAYIYIS